MFRQLFIFALVATALVQCVPHRVVEPSIYLQENVVDGKIADWIEQLKHAVTDAISAAIKNLTDIAAAVKAKVNEIIEEVKKELSAEAQALLEELQRFKDAAKELGIDIKDCLAENEQKLIDLPKTFLNRIQKCGEDAAKAGEDILDQTKEHIQEELNNVKVLTDAYSACEDVSCKLDVAKKIAGEIITAPLDIGKSVAEVSKRVGNVLLDMNRCAVSNVKSLATEGKALLSEIANCVEDKIKPTENPEGLLKM